MTGKEKTIIDSLRENPAIRILINIILGVVLFEILFGLVFNGSSAGAIQSLANVVQKLILVIIALAVMAGVLLMLNKVFAWKGEEKLMNLDRDQIIKGVIIGILALIAFALLSNLFHNGSGINPGPGFQGHGGEGMMYGYNGGSSLSGLLGSILSLLITLMSVALVVFLGIGAYKLAAPHLNTEFSGMFKAQPKNKCANCARELSADWQVCPYCGTSTVRDISLEPEAQPFRESSIESVPVIVQVPTDESAEKPEKTGE